jgi:L-ascorbate metabolism protein UlaG (beta-lactamase superfamily)
MLKSDKVSMIINYYGGDYFKIQAGNLTVLVDPENQRSFKGATLVLNTVQPGLAEAPAETAPFWIDHQGEYEVQDIRVEGRSLGEEDRKEKTAYRMDIDEIRFGILGHLTKDPDPSVQELLKDCDVLIIPGSDKPMIGAAAAAKLIRQLEPSIVIPSFAKNPKVFLKEMGQEKAAPEEKFVFKKKELVPKAMAVKYLSF